MQSLNRAGTGPRRPSLIVTFGLAGVVLMFIGITTMSAFGQPPFFDADEKAHLGYAQEVVHLRLPEIDRPAPVPATATQWDAELSTAQDPRYRGVWVANHPPLHYLSVAPLIRFANATHRPDGGLLLMRLANIAFAAVGVAFTYLLAKELAGGSCLTGLLAATVVALVPQGHTYFSRGLNDGLAFAVGTALVWATLRLLRRPDHLGDRVVLASVSALAAGARTSTMLLAVVMISVIVLHRASVPRTQACWDRIRAATMLAITLFGPAIVLFGWFYVRTAVLYGDIGGSAHLLAYFNREPRGSIPDVVRNGHLWVEMYQRMASTAPLSWEWPGPLNIVVLITVAALIMLVVWPPANVSRPNLIVCLTAVATVTVLVAQHLAGGGNPYPRYFFPMLGVLAALVVLSLSRLASPLLPTALTTAMAVWALARLPVGLSPATTIRPRDDGVPPPIALRTLPVGDGWRIASVVLIAAGVITLATVIIALCVQSVRTPPRRSLAGAIGGVKAEFTPSAP